MPEQNVVTQNPRDFAVQIRHCDDTDAIIGTGVAVSMDGAIVTCAHVVRMAGVEPRQAGDVEVPVYFPQVRGGEAKLRRARITGYFPNHDDDVVLLQLADGPAPLAPEQIAQVGTAGTSFMHPFISYGYRARPPYRAGYARGTILGCIECPTDRKLQVEPLELESAQISEGMSGSPVLDQDRNLVIGIVSETYYPPDHDPKDRDLAWAVDAHVLTFDPFNFALRDTPLPKRAAPQPQALPDPRMALLRPWDKLVLHGAPPVLDEWVGRDDLLRKLDDDWADPDTRVTALVGFGGEGKSSLARTWVDRVVKRQTANVKRQRSRGHA